MNENEKKLVTTDSDFWNSADEAHFALAKGQVKPLPEITTAIIDNALEQGLLREASKEEIEKQEFYNSVESAIEKRLISIGKDYAETIKNYQKYLDVLKLKEQLKDKIIEEKKLEDVKKPEEVKKPIEAVKL
jgi:TRAP-type mannitol/chloroaromatic compound transport system substrate-binding protein